MRSSSSPSGSSPSRRSVLGLLGAVPLAAIPGAAHAAGGGSPAVPKDLRPGGAYDRLLSELAARDEFSGTVLLAHRGRAVLARSHGMADKRLSIPNGPDTIFNLASVGKFFTGVAIMQLVAAGKVRLNDRLGRHADGFTPAIADTVTIHHLLTHTSGLGNYRADPQWLADRASWRTPADSFDGTMAVIRRQAAPAFLPGSDYSYSNSGYYVLGAIVAAVSGGTFWDYVHQQVFVPARMDSASFATNQQWQTGHRFAHAYGPIQPDGSRADLTEQEQGIGIGGGAGGGFASAADMLGFAQALTQGTLLTPAYTELMISGKQISRQTNPGGGTANETQPHSQPPSDAQAPANVLMTAYGTIAAIINGHRRIGHGGGSAGITTNISIYPERDWVTIILSNYSLAAALRPLLELQDQLITGQP